MQDQDGQNNNLGITLGKKLRFHQHNKKANNSAKHMRSNYITRIYTETENNSIHITSTITTAICLPCLGTAAHTHLHKLQVIQNRAACRIALAG